MSQEATNVPSVEEDPYLELEGAEVSSDIRDEQDWEIISSILRLQLDEAKQENARLKAQLESMTKESYERKISSLKATLEKAKQKEEEYKDTIKRMESEYAKLTGDNEHLRKNYYDLQKMLQQEAPSTDEALTGKDEVYTKQKEHKRYMTSIEHLDWNPEDPFSLPCQKPTSQPHTPKSVKFKGNNCQKVASAICNLERTFLKEGIPSTEEKPVTTEQSDVDPLGAGYDPWSFD